MYGDIERFDEPKPSDEYANSLLWIRSPAGQLKATEAYNVAKKKLTGRDCFSCLFNSTQIAEAGNRNNTIHKFVGQAVYFLHGDPCIRPEHIYALFLTPVQQLDDEPGQAAWTDILWLAIGTNWAKERAKTVHVEQQQMAAAVAGVELTDRVLNGMRGWCLDKTLDADGRAVVLGFPERHLIASVSNCFFMMRPDGYYDPTPVSQPQLLAAIRSRGMDALIRTTIDTEDGRKTDRPVSAVVAQYATICKTVEAVPNLKGGGD